MRKHLTTIILILLLLTGLSFLLYPTVSDWWNSLHQSRAIAGYTEAVAGLDGESYDTWWAGAREYNAGSYTQLRAPETVLGFVGRLLL